MAIHACVLLGTSQSLILVVRQACFILLNAGIHSQQSKSTKL
jgi:hypothetical protein